MRINFILLMLLIFLSACKSKQQPEYITLADKITGQVCEEITLPKDLHLTGYGGALIYDVKELALHFDACECLNLEEARKLYIEMTETYLDYINEDEAIKPYLHNYPFTIQNLDLTIAFLDRSGAHQGNGCIAFIFFNPKTSEIFFRTYNPDNDKLTPFHEEPYEEAKRIVQGSE